MFTRKSEPPLASKHNLLLPARRLILLGASNLSRSFPNIVATARATWREPLEIMVAMGHGRSYGHDTTIFGRKISGIFPCALWQDLQTRAAMPTTALVTDIGNDLLYEISPDQLHDWVSTCVDRLLESGAAITITQLPIGNLERLSERRFQLFRRMFFPRSRLTLANAKALANKVNARLLELGESRKIPVIPVSCEWYGFDPIHVRRGAMRVAWPTMFAPWCGDEPRPTIARPSLWTAAYLASLAPRERWFFGIRRAASQPNGRLHDGTTISLY
jgi:hypothetical protein